ncbi:hypothetical protein P7C73_g2741, partial [Tremellales sp. Uapishka_1]
MASNPATATRIVKNLLSAHSHLSTQQLWKLGTAGTKPILPPAQVLTADGRIRMKKVSNIREGRRIWVPPAVPPLPDHPFQSKTHLKSVVLESLASHGLIHKKRILRPHETDEERQAAINQAAKESRRAIRNAKEKKTPLPAPKIPSPYTVEYAWVMGPPAEEVGTEEEPRESLGWLEVEQMELSMERAKELEAEQTNARKEERKARFKYEREQQKKQREEDIGMGRVEAKRAAAVRDKALKRVVDYAKETGEDVRDWYEELGGNADDLTAVYAEIDQVGPGRARERR